MTATASDQAKIYHNTGSYATPTWDEMDWIRDVTLSLPTAAAEASNRAGGGWEEFIEGLISLTINCSADWDESNADQDVIKTAKTGRSGVEILCLDGDEGTSGNEGIRATCMVEDFERVEVLGESQKLNFSLRPRRNSDAAPAWYEVA